MAGELFGITYTAFRSNFTRLKNPYKLNFAITMWCQSRCLTCNIWEMKPKNELSLEEIQSFSKKNAYFRWIGLTGGEPFLRSDIVDVAKTFKEHSTGLYILTIPTNSLCNQDKEIGKIREMLELKIPRIVITVSLDGNREMHDKVRGVDGNFDKAVSMFKRLKELQGDYPALDVVFGYTISKINEGNLDKTYESVREIIPNITYNDFHLNLAQLSDNYYHNANTGILADRDIAAKEIMHARGKMSKKLGLMQKVESEFVDGLVKFAGTGIPPIKCRSLDASLFLDSFGNVYPSIMWNYKVGNIRDAQYDLGSIWHCEAAEDARLKIQRGLDPKHWTSCEAYQSILGNIVARHKNVPVQMQQENPRKIEVDAIQQ